MTQPEVSPIHQLFDSRNAEYRHPFGAVEEGCTVLFRILLPRWLGCRGAYLIRCPDGGDEALDGMFWAGQMDDSYEWWDCRYTPEKAGLVWYGFQLETGQGRRYLVRQPDATAALSASPGPLWQLTCYEQGFRTPDWLAGGVMYQIFPDRFARAEETGPVPLPDGRILRDDWGGEPGWRPDEQGEIRNNDYFGGNLRGIEQRLDRLAELGVTCLYLNPIFEAHSNHRYDTADYRKIDPLLGTEEDFRRLCETAARLGIRVLLDGVFSHTGADSVYFNKEGRYPGLGACQSPDSPYFSWYRFRRWPEEYDGWWGFVTLPEVQELDPSFMEFVNGPDGVVASWLAAGASGWRLDVADELPDGFLDALRNAARAAKPDALVLGEVWEDASNKEAYGQRRRYLLGRQLDSVMNYPFRDAILGFLRGGDAGAFVQAVQDILEHYPPAVNRLLMNHIGTHDTERALTALAGEPAGGRGRDWQAAQKLTPERRARGLRLMRLASALQYCLPGVPCVYYGDEAGMEGYRDPFNRGCYPWGEEDPDLLAWYRRLGRLRKAATALKEGRFRPLARDGAALCFERRDGEAALLCAVNRGDTEAALPLPEGWAGWTVNLGDGRVEGDILRLPPLGCAILIDNGEEI